MVGCGRSCLADLKHAVGWWEHADILGHFLHLPRRVMGRICDHYDARLMGMTAAEVREADERRRIVDGMWADPDCPVTQRCRR